MCLGAVEWALFRKRKGWIKEHTLYVLETQIPYSSTSPLPKRMTGDAKETVPYDSFYIFDRGYNGFKPMKRKMTAPRGSRIESDAIGYMDGQLTRRPIKLEELFAGTMKTIARSSFSLYLTSTM